MTAFQVLAEPIRVFLISRLCVGEQPSGDLAVQAHEQFGIGWSATSRHLVVLRRSGFVRVIADERARWYCLEDDWIDLVDAEVQTLRDRWDQTAEYRGYGFSSAVPAMPRPFDPGSAPHEVRGRRGRAATNRADRGVGRSEWVDDTDGGAGLE